MTEGNNNNNNNQGVSRLLAARKQELGATASKSGQFRVRLHSTGKPSRARA